MNHWHFVVFCSLGLSNFNSQQVDEIISKGRIKPAVLQVECHPYLNQAELIEHCKNKGVVGETGFTIMSLYYFVGLKHATTWSKLA